MTEMEFETWFAATDLGDLEDVRAYVELHALDNAAGNYDTAKATVEIYMDDPDSAAIFKGYRA